MTTIKNIGKFSFYELCKALELDNENDFLFVPVSELQVIRVFFTDFIPPQDADAGDSATTTIKVTEEVIELSLGESIKRGNTTKAKLFSDIENVLSDYLFEALYRYLKQENQELSKERILSTYPVKFISENKSPVPRLIALHK
ncbi:hypothetical protein [Mucilaginibacter sp. SP1R1]|uniref:hypothetical protein n=1 Tax=Mucilaginibacter sp. SP1R1 TaxID=2723091 RepID=UPI00161CF641|nr:hypothetical protein [Mucilaginibacter sp. SP1R1]MBB6148309.1 hypothetical protein [Mucilaginibacter sp. SP1R1]